MRKWTLLWILPVLFSGWMYAQQTPSDSAQPQSEQAPPQNRGVVGESSSRDTRIDVSPPKDDAKDHPNSSAITDSASDVDEMHPWNPHKAAQDIEVGDYYLKLKNYKGALARYQDALYWKDNDATANFRLAECYEKLNQREEAISHYQAYLKVLPQGPESKHAKKALEKLSAAAEKTGQ